MIFTESELDHIGSHPTWHYGSLVFNSDTIIATLFSAAVVLILGFIVRAKVSAEKPGKLQLAFDALTVGAIAGYLAGFIVKGDERYGVIGHIVLGIVGALIGGYVVTLITGNDPMDAFFDLSAWLVAIVSAVILVILVNTVTGRSRTGSGPV